MDPIYMNISLLYLSIYLRRDCVVYAFRFSFQTLERGIYKMHYPHITKTYKHIFPLCSSFHN